MKGVHESRRIDITQWGFQVVSGLVTLLRSAGIPLEGVQAIMRIEAAAAGVACGMTKQEYLLAAEADWDAQLEDDAKETKS